jgi:acyl carrier protein
MFFFAVFAASWFTGFSKEFPMSEVQTLSERVQALVAEAIQAPPELVTPELAFGDLPQWDSLGHMEVMLRLEEQFGVAVDTDMIAELVSVPDICTYLETNGHVQ